MTLLESTALGFPNSINSCTLGGSVAGRGVTSSRASLSDLSFPAVARDLPVIGTLPRGRLSAREKIG